MIQVSLYSNRTDKRIKKETVRDFRTGARLAKEWTANDYGINGGCFAEFKKYSCVEWLREKQITFAVLFVNGEQMSGSKG
jgi:hypothetical protein